MNDSDFAWMDGEPAKALTAIKERPEYAKALTAMTALSPKQRLYLDALLDSDLEPEAARKLLYKRRRVRVRRAEREAWLNGDANFAQALTSVQEFACSAVAISKAATLLKLNRLANDTRKLIEFEDKQGNKFLRPVDASAAHAALVSLAKITGALTPEARGTTVHNNAPTYVYQVISSKGVRADVIEGEVVDVTPPSSKKQ